MQTREDRHNFMKNKLLAVLFIFIFIVAVVQNVDFSTSSDSTIVSQSSSDDSTSGSFIIHFPSFPSSSGTSSSDVTSGASRG